MTNTIKQTNIALTQEIDSPWGCVQPDEFESLKRVEKQFLTQLEHHQQLDQKFSIIRFGSFATACTVLGMALFFLFHHSFQQRPSHHLKLYSNSALQMNKKFDHYQIHARAHRIGLLSTKKWKMKIKPGTILRLSHLTSQTSRFNIKKGFVQVHVKPGTMKDFSISCFQGYKVIVRGTRFTIEQRKSWLRVETQKGKVVIQTPQQKMLQLPKEKGVFIQAPKYRKSKHTIFAYNAPPTELKQPHNIIEWMAKRHPQQLFQYALTFNTIDVKVRKFRDEVLTMAAHYLERQKNYQKAALLWKHIYKMYLTQLSYNSAEQALLSSIQSCAKKNIAMCQPLLLTYFRQFRKVGMLNQHAIYWMVQSLQSKSHLHKATLWTKKYIEHYPQGTHIKWAKQTLKRLQSEITQGQK